MQRITATILLIALLAVTLISCSGGNTQSTPASTTGGEVASSSDTEPETTVLKADVPKEDYNGYEFRFMGQPQATDRAYDDLDSEELTGNAINDAIYKRNTATEEYFNIKISRRDESNPASILNSAALSGDDSFDACFNVTTSMFGSIKQGYVLDIDKLSYVDIEKPWWTTQVIETNRIAGKTFLLYGDCLTRDKDSTWCLLFNKRLYKDLGLAEPYDTVRSGKWTLDLLKEHCSDVTKDLNGDGVLDYNDHWGLLSSDTAVIGLVTSCDVFTIDNNEKGLEFILNSPRNVDILQKIFDFSTDSTMELRANDIKGVSDIWVTIKKVFQEGRALYRISIVKDALDMRDMEDDFGIIPLPKYDENQAEYRTMYQAWNCRSLCVPITVKSTDQVSSILEYLTYASRDTVREAYYDVTLAGKLARDADSTEMLDLIFNSLTSDIGLMSEVGGVRTMIVNMMKVSGGNIASTLASNAEPIKTAIEELTTAISAIQ